MARQILFDSDRGLYYEEDPPNTKPKKEEEAKGAWDSAKETAKEAYAWYENDCPEWVKIAAKEAILLGVFTLLPGSPLIKAAARVAKKVI